jgi:hypothetical protein
MHGDELSGELSPACVLMESDAGCFMPCSLAARASESR